MTSKPFAVPLRPDFGAVRHRGANALIRAIAATLAARADEASFPEDALARNWGTDRDALLVLRAATNPATMSSSSWAGGSLASTAIADFVAGLAPVSAAAQLLQSGIQLQFQGKTAIAVPALLAAATGVGFVAEGAPISVRQLSVDTGPTLAPRKFATIVPFSRELFLHSAVSVEVLVRTVLQETVGLALDAAMFDSSAGDATRPAGLRNGISATFTASTATPPSEALLDDISDLVAAVAPVAGNAAVILVASPKQAASLRLWMRGLPTYLVLSSSALTAGTVIAIASNALVSAIDPAPRFEVSTEAVLHLVDTAPAQIGTSGTPNVVAAPARSLFQTDVLALRLVMELSWALRASGGLAWTQAVTW